MTYKLVPFTQEHLQPAVELFTQRYRAEQADSPCLPSRVLDDPDWIKAALRTKLDNPGVAVIEQGQLLAYMVTSAQFSKKGQQAAFVQEYCHSAIPNRKQELYQRMYQSLAQEWVNKHIHLHLIGHFAHDALLQETLYQIGFGALVTERLRDCSAIDVGPDQTIKQEQDVSKLLDLHLEHIHYYPGSPIFTARSADRHSALADLESHAQNGDVFFVTYERDEPCAYLIVGESAIGAEGFLLQETNTAQVKSAYARTGMRGKGIGKALLWHAIEWSKNRGYERLFVEHETANLTGSAFWSRYFAPYLYFSMRYVDNRL
ncbi:MAG: GNAT family N-acetyltransferase [Anaerolineae bacterium]|nr:GNAT family N-acetyltransferase [Anaerolineae bacterium]